MSRPSARRQNGIRKKTLKLFLRDFARAKFQIDAINSRIGVEVRANLRSRNPRILSSRKMSDLIRDNVRTIAALYALRLFHKGSEILGNQSA